MTWLLNKITVSTPKGSHCTRCVCVCELHLVGGVYLSGYFSVRVEGFGAERQKTRTPLPQLPHPSPVSYCKCVVNQKRLVVGAEQILREVHFEQSCFFCNVEGIVDLFRPRPWLNDYYDLVWAFVCVASVTSGSAAKVNLCFSETKERGLEIESERGKRRPKKRLWVNERNSQIAREEEWVRETERGEWQKQRESREWGEEEGVTEHCFSRAERTKAPLCAVLREWSGARA